MTQLGFFVDPSDAVERSFDGPSTPVPAGWYDAVIKKADILSTKAGGHRINVRYDITGPTNAGRVVFSSINLDHPENPLVAEIGKQHLALVAAALNKRISDTDEMIGGELRIHVKISKSKSPEYADSNTVDMWGRSASALPSAASAPSSAPKSGNTPPWVK